MYGEVLPDAERRAASAGRTLEVWIQRREVDREDPLRGQAAANTWELPPREYGFYANVNPTVDHPRWSQARERRLGELRRPPPTEMFNGYADQVHSLYAGMDLRRIF